MSEGTWIKCSVNGSFSGEIFGAATCLVDRNLWYLYGGAKLSSNGTNMYYNDLVRLSLNGNKVVSTTLQTKGVHPGNRVGSSLFQQGNYLYLIGGTKNEFTLEYASEAYTYDMDLNTWYQVEVINDPCVVSCSYSLHTDTVYIFGGVNVDEPSNTLYSLNLGAGGLKLECKLVETKGTPPSPRVDHSSVVAGNKLFVYGGSGAQNLWYNDLYVLDLKSLKWGCVSLSCDVLPPPCDFGVMSSLDSHYLVLFGGSNDSLDPTNTFNQLWYFSLTGGTWHQVQVLDDSSLPVSRYLHSLCTVDDFIYVYGGLGDNNSTLQDLWMFSLNSNNLKGRAIPPCQIENPPPPIHKFTVEENIPDPPAITDFEIPEIEKHTGLDTLRAAIIGQIAKAFDVLEQEYEVLYRQREKLEREKRHHAATREKYNDWLSQQRDSLVRQCEDHTSLCKSWALKQSQQFTQERQVLLDERRRLERAQSKLYAEQEQLNTRVRRVESLIERARVKE